MLNIVKILLVIIALSSSYQIYIDRIQALDTPGSLILYIALFVVLSAFLLATAFINNVYIRIAWASLFLVSFTFYETCQRIFGEALSYQAFLSLVAASDFINESLEQYVYAVALSAFLGIILFLGIVLPGTRIKTWNVRYLSFAPLLGCILLTTVVYTRDGNGASGLPSVFTPIAYSTVLLQKTLVRSDLSRKNVTISSTESSIVGDIVLILDESVRGDYLDINYSAGVNSSLKSIHPHVSMNNYGIAVSATNCSAGTNQIIRFGGNPHDFRYRIKTYPSIWQYAKSAGFETVYIDSQRTGATLHNNMRIDETKNIDSFIQFNYTPVLLRDMDAADTIKRLANNDIREFVFVTKVGAHFPVNDKYPDEYKEYLPALSRGRFLNVSDMAKRKSGLTSINWEYYKNSYKNTLLWSTGEFFRRLLESSDLKDSVIIYTSDHGQNFHEKNQPGLNTHCSEAPSMEEGVVPLVVIAGNNISKPDFRKSAEHHFNKASHFALFPTLLRLFGFDKEVVMQEYGPSLLDSETYPFAFNYSFFAEDSSEDKWMFVNPDNISK